MLHLKMVNCDKHDSIPMGGKVTGAGSFHERTVLRMYPGDLKKNIRVNRLR